MHTLSDALINAHSTTFDFIMFIFCHLTLSPLSLSSPVTVVGRTVGLDRIVHLVLHRRGRVRHPQRLHSRRLSRPRAKLLIPTHHLSQVCGAYDGRHGGWHERRGAAEILHRQCRAGR